MVIYLTFLVALLVSVAALSTGNEVCSLEINKLVFVAYMYND